MFKKIVIATIVATTAAMVWTAGAVQASSYPDCSDVQGGNVTYTLCNGYSADHFWSGTKVKLQWQDANGAYLRVTNTNGSTDYAQYYDKDHETLVSNVINIADGTTNGKTIELKITYLGPDTANANRGLVKITSNATYQDSLVVNQSGLLPAPVVSISTPYAKDGGLVVDITWDSIPGASHYYFVVEEENLSGPSLDGYDLTHYDGVIDGTKYTVAVEEGKTYRVNGSAYRSTESMFNNPNNWSDYHYFDVVPASINLTAPTSVWTSSQYGADYASINLTDISWSKVINAHKYELYIELETNGVYSFHNNYLKFASEGETLSGFPMYNMGDYYRVKVRALDTSDNPGPWSDWTYFFDTTNSPHTVDDTENPTATISADKQSYYEDEYIYLSVNANDNVGVSKIEILDVADTLYETCYNTSYCSYDFGPPNSTQGYYSAFGLYQFYTKVYDEAGNIGMDYTEHLEVNPRPVVTPVLDTPLITFPADNDSIYHDKSVYFSYGDDIAERQLYTTWEVINGADYYIVDYNVKNLGNWIEYDNDFYVNGLKDQLYGWIDEGKYRVRVKAFSNESQESEWSDWIYFEIYDHDNATSSGQINAGDGNATGYRQLSYYHSPTGITVNVRDYDHGVVYLDLQNADKSEIYVINGSEYFADSFDGTKRLHIKYNEVNKSGISLSLNTQVLVDSEPDPLTTPDGRNNKRLTDLKMIQTGLELFYTDNGYYPSSNDLVVLGSGNASCLDSNGWGSSCNGLPYMSNVPQDPGHTYYGYFAWGYSYIITASIEGTFNGYSGMIYVNPNGIASN